MLDKVSSDTMELPPIGEQLLTAEESPALMFSENELNAMAQEAKASEEAMTARRRTLINVTAAYNEEILNTELKSISGTNVEVLPCILSTLTKKEIQEVSLKKSVDYVGYFPDDEMVNTSATYAQAASTVGSASVKSTYGLTGKGVDVGMIENDYPNNGNAIAVKNDGDTPSGKSEDINHANVVSTCIKTAAPDVTLYATTAQNRGNIFGAFNALLDKGVFAMGSLSRKCWRKYGIAVGFLQVRQAIREK